MIVRWLGLVVAQVGPDGAVPVDVGEPRGRRVRAARSSAPVTAGAGALLEPALELVDDLAHDRARGLARPRRDHAVERQQRADQVDVRLDRVEQLGLEQQLVRGPRRSIASCCITCTTASGSTRGCRPSQRATRRRTSCRARRCARLPLAVERVERVASMLGVAADQREAGAVGAVASPRTSRQRRNRSSAHAVIARGSSRAAAAARARRARGRARSSPAATVAAPRPRRARDALADLPPLGRRERSRRHGAAAAARR